MVFISLFLRAFTNIEQGSDSDEIPVSELFEKYFAYCHVNAIPKIEKQLYEF